MTFSLVLVGCGRKEVSPQRELVLSLADTVWADREREVLLTTGSGCYFYDDALGRPRKSQYGFSLMDARILAEWQVMTESGEQLNIEAEYAVLHPEYCRRRYASGLEVTIEAVAGADALFVTIQLPERSSATVRVWLDSSPVDATGNRTTALGPTPSSRSDLPSSAPASAFVEFSVRAERRPAPESRVVDYAESRLRGDVSQALLDCQEEFRLLPSREWSFCLGVGSSRAEAAGLARAVVQSPDKWRSRRRNWSESALGAFDFRCDKPEIERAVAWARLTLSSLYFAREGRAMLLAGIPHSPWVDGFHACLSAVGLGLTDSRRLRPLQIFETIVMLQDTAGPPETRWRLPTEIGRAVIPTYASAVTAGAAALTFERVVAESDTLPPSLAKGMDIAIDAAVAAETIGPNLVAGLMTSDGLFPDVGFPPQPRVGATIETQALFATARRFLRRRGKSGDYIPRTPYQLLEGVSAWALPNLAPIAVGGNGKQYRVPLSADAMLKLYRNPRTGVWFDRLLLPERADDPAIVPKMKFPPPVDSTQRAAHLLALGWLRPGDKRLNDQLLARAQQNGLIGPVGLRSLAMDDSAFQSSHIYQLDGEPVKTTNCGDILVWTAGRLADMWRLAGQQDSLQALFGALTDQLRSEGTIGALPEALNGVPTAGIDNTTRNPVFATSLAEYLRIFYDHILGIDAHRQQFVWVSPNIPASWGNVRFSCTRLAARIALQRRLEGVWSASYVGSDEPLTLSVELFPESGQRALGSFQLRSGEEVEFEAAPSGEGRWTIAKKESPR